MPAAVAQNSLLLQAKLLLAALLLKADPNSFRKLVSTLLEANSCWDATLKQLERCLWCPQALMSCLPRYPYSALLSSFWWQV